MSKVRKNQMLVYQEEQRAKSCIDSGKFKSWQGKNRPDSLTKKAYHGHWVK